GIWDDYQRLAGYYPQRPRPSTFPPLPQRVVFLSGRTEKCAEYLPTVLDAHLQPPYRASHLARIWNRLTAPGFQARPLDIFFLKTQARYRPIRYGDLCQVHRLGSRLLVQTRCGDFMTTGSLTALRIRLPMPLAPVRRGWLVNEAYDG